MDPELVAGLEIGDGGDGEGLAGAGDADINLGPDEIEARVGDDLVCSSRGTGGPAAKNGHAYPYC